MRKSEIEIGKWYVAKVSGQTTRVRIESISQYGGWNAVNAKTGRVIRIKSAQRLYRKADPPKTQAPRRLIDWHMLKGGGA